jgi:ring-1,2-phenylacetyl-CoA epoxidase subunit PaaD
MNTINSAIEDKIIQLLSEIPDPEIPVVNIIELGMLKGISTDEHGTVVVQLMPTYTACPATYQIKSDVEKN